MKGANIPLSYAAFKKKSQISQTSFFILSSCARMSKLSLAVLHVIMFPEYSTPTTMSNSRPWGTRRRIVLGLVVFHGAHVGRAAPAAWIKRSSEVSNSPPPPQPRLFFSPSRRIMDSDNIVAERKIELTSLTVNRRWSAAVCVHHLARAAIQRNLHHSHNSAGRLMTMERWLF